MQLYELTVVLPADEAKSKASVEKLEKTIKDAAGAIKEKAEWGKRYLSYPIKKNIEGTYVLYQLELEAERVGGFNRLLQNDESILRHLIVRLDKTTPLTPAKAEVKAEKKAETQEKADVESKTKSKSKSAKIAKTETKAKGKK